MPWDANPRGHVSSIQRFAGIADTVPGLFVSLVNDAIRGSIAPRSIRYEPPSTVVLEDVLLSDPSGAPVAQVKRGTATLSLRALLSREIVISALTIDAPRFVLESREGKLNLLEALTPRKPPDRKRPPETAFRIDAIVVTDGGFRYTDGKTVTVTADGIGARGSLELDLARDLVLVTARDTRVQSGVVKLPDLDVPFTGLEAGSVRIFKDALLIDDAAGTAAGAHARVSGRIAFPPAGSLDLRARVDAPANAWPERLARLPFDTPSMQADVRVAGPYDDVKVGVGATLGGASAWGYATDGGRAEIEVRGGQLRILDGTRLRLLGGGSIAAEGTLALSSRELDLRARAEDVPLATALAPAALQTSPLGLVSARATVRGKADGASALAVDGSYSGRRVELFGVRARGNLEGTARVIVAPDRVTLQDVTLGADRLRARARGDYAIGDKRVALEVSASADDATALVPALPPEVRADGVQFEGTVRGVGAAATVGGQLRAASGSAYGVPIRGLEARVDASTESVSVRQLAATVADGALRQMDVLTVTLGQRREIRGSLVLEEADLGRVQAAHPEHPELPVSGRGSVAVTLAGAAADPIATLRLLAHDVAVAGEAVADVDARGTATRRTLVLDEVSVRGPLARATSRDLRLSLVDLRVTGRIQLDHLDLGMIEAARRAALTGTARGVVTLAGELRAPRLGGRLEAQQLALGPQRFGSGPLEVGLLPDAGAAAGTVGRVAQLAGRLGSDRGTWDVLLALALERRVLNARAVLNDVDVASLTTHLGTAVAPLEGFASGTVEAWGALERPSLRARILVPELAVSTAPAGSSESASGSAAAPVGLKAPSGPWLHGSSAATRVRAARLRPLGAVFVEAAMDAGELVGRVCAFPVGNFTPEPDTPCARGERVWAKVTGSVAPLDGALDLTVDARVLEPDVEDFVAALAAREVGVGLDSRITAQVTRAAGGALRARADLALSNASVEPPGAVQAELVAPTRLTWDGDRLRFAEPARFASQGGEVDVTVGGEAGHEEIALTVEGTAALSLTKLITQQIANASGTVRTRLAIRGRYDTGLSIDGELAPAPGAVITPRALGQPVAFQGGRVTLAPRLEDGAQLLRVVVDQLAARVGDGELQLRGTLDARTAGGAEQGWVKRWDLAAIGSGLEFRSRSARGEGALDLRLVSQEAGPQLSGSVEVTDGLFRKDFELRNFVLAPPPEKESDPLWVTLEPLGLADLGIDVRATLQNFRVRADVATFNADLRLRGTLRLGNTLRLPVVVGAIEAEEGDINFPRARFEVLEMQVEFPAGRDGRLNPLVHLGARTEIPPGGAGSNDTEIPVELFLDGGLEKGINLDLVATDPQREWGRSDLLGVILFGQSLESTVATGDASIALRALVREATSPITAELERLAQETLGVRVELDPSGWRWQLGRRLQIEGAVQLLSTPDSSAAASTSGNTTNTAFDAVRLRFLIVDHLTVGKNLSLEGRQGTAGGDLRLSLRLFEE